MIKIETDYDASKASCLLEILKHGTTSTCDYFCQHTNVGKCPYNDIYKLQCKIAEFIKNAKGLETSTED